MKKRKILYSPGFGAGWISWARDDEIEKFMSDFEPIIVFLEGGGSFEGYPTTLEWDDCYDDDDNPIKSPDTSILHPILKEFADQCWIRFKDIPYLGGARDLQVANVTGLFRIEEYDGSESIVEKCSDDYEWM